MRIHFVALLPLIFFSITGLSSSMVNEEETGVSVDINIEAPIPGYMSYRGCSFTLEVLIRNELGETVNVSVETVFEPFTIVWSNFSSIELDPGTSIAYSWVLQTPRNISYGNYTLGLNITYTANSTVYSMYWETWIEIIPRNVSLLTADLYRNATRYYLVVSNPLTDPGQYIVENVSITIEPFNVSVAPREVFIDELRANGSCTVSLSINFNESDIGALLVNISTRDDVHGLVFFNYTFIVVNATAYLDLYVIDDYGRPLDNATVTIDGEMYFTDENGSVSLVLPIGICNYTVIYNEHRVSGELFLHTGHNMYTVVVDLTSPVIVSVKQKGYGVMVEAYDPGINCSGVQRIVFIQGDRVWNFTIRPTRNMTILLYPSLYTGKVIVKVLDSQDNAVNVTFYYSKPGRPNYLQELMLVASIVLILVIVVLLFSLRS